MRRRIQKKDMIRQLESRRDMLMDRGFVNRAKAIENQIRVLKRDVRNIEES